MKHTLIFVALLPSAAMAEDWHGVWSAESDWCVNASRIGSTTPAPIELSATEMLGYENSCDITKTTVLPDMNAWMLNLTCQSEGESYHDQRLVMTDGQNLWMWGGYDAPVRFARCPA